MIDKKNIISGSNLKNKEEVFELIADQIYKNNKNVDTKSIVQGFLKREGESSTGFEKGFAIPHTKVDNLGENEIFIIKNLSVDWPSMDGNKTEVAIAILVDANSPKEHLAILTKISRKLLDENFQNILKNGSDDQILNELNGLEKVEKKQEDSEKSNRGHEYIIGVTACPTGIAHTYMAAESLEKTAKELGYKVKIETRGQGGVGNELTQADIKEAKGVIIACDIDVPLDRFDGKKLIKVPVKDGIYEAKKLINSLDQAKEYHAKGEVSSSSKEEKTTVYASLMTGVTYMLPFVVVGGIFTALRFLFGTPDDIAAGVQPLIYNLQLGEFFGNIGGILFGLMLPVLAGYIAYSIGNRAALMPGFLAGMMAQNQGSGFLGALLGGFLAGYIAKYLFSIIRSVPKSLQGSYQILFLPLLGALLIGLFMAFFGIPIKWLNDTLTNLLLAIQGASPILLGALVGAMMASDMGGPINKAAYVTGTVLLADGNQTFMAAVMAGGMVPPLAIGFATVMFKNKYTKEEQEAGKTNFIMGLSFVTEGAIPFAAKNPKRVIPPIMLGSAIAGALTMVFGVELPAPHGGIFVFPLVTHVWAYVFSILVGSIVGAVVLAAVKEGE